MKAKRTFSLAAMVLVALCAGSARGGVRGLIRNPDNDPDLAEALAHDAEHNHGVEAESDQAVAARHYLAYLARVEDPARRARILVQLGALFSTDFLRSKGEKPDYQRALGYFKEALEAEPERINVPMIRARLNLVHPDMSAEDRLAGRMELYEWLLSLDGEKVWKLAMPDNPGEEVSEDDVKWLVDYCGKVTSTTARNMVQGARLTKAPLDSLKRIQQRFPGTEADRQATALVEEYAKAVQELVEKEGIEQIEGKLADTPAVEGQTRRDGGQAPAAAEAGALRAGAEKEQDRSGRLVAAWLLAAVGVAAILGLGWLWWRRRRAGKVPSP